MSTEAAATTDGKPMPAFRADAAESPAEAATANPGPTDPDDRILSLDVLRGFALLGILVINVWLFGMPIAGAINPALYGDFSGGNYLAWLVSHVFFEQKFVTLFSILFGAGIVLFTRSKERAGGPALWLHFRRTAWLLVVGLGHAYLLWFGDILVYYALAGAALVFVRHWSPRRLLALGLFMLAVPSAIYLLGGVSYLAADAGAESDVQEQVLVGMGATEDAIQAELAAYRGGWLDQVEYRAAFVPSQQTFGFLLEYFWLYGGLMAVGMALFKWDVLSNRRSDRFYRRLLLGGGLVGLALIGAGVWYRSAVGWETGRVALLARQFNYWGSLPLALSYVAGVALLCRRAADSAVTTALAAVGKTAFSNYLLQTVLATTVFYGHGLGLYGSLSRLELLGVVVVIWTIQVPLSVLWLRRFRYGPVEWVWRTLTYGERQPLVRAGSQ